MDIVELNSRIENIVARQAQLRVEIDAIVAPGRRRVIVAEVTNYIDRLVVELCPDGVEYRPLSNVIEKNYGGGTLAKLRKNIGVEISRGLQLETYLMTLWRFLIQGQRLLLLELAEAPQT